MKEPRPRYAFRKETLEPLGKETLKAIPHPSIRDSGEQTKLDWWDEYLGALEDY